MPRSTAEQSQGGSRRQWPEVPGYAIESRLGVGGFATVYLARQLRLNRLVALKVMNASAATGPSAGPEFASRFLREGRDTALLGNHPNIVTVYDIDCQNGVYFIAMQFISGPTLKDLLHGETPYQHPLHIVRRLASALAYAHEKGLVHRDIKPANILFNERHEAVLSDFGIARSMGSRSDLTEVGAVIGTAAYMSPEQAQGLADIDGRSDLYSLGVVLYELLTGQKPYRGAQATATLLKHLNDPIPRLPPTQREYQPLIDTLMAKAREDRYPSGQALLEDINRRYFRRDNDMPTVVLPATERTALSGSPTPPSAASALPHLPRGAIVTLATVGLAVLLALVMIPPPGGPSTIAEPTTVQGGSPPGAMPDPMPRVAPDAPAVIDPEGRERIQRLLDVAALHEAVGRIDDPPGANAVEAYRAVLAIDAGHDIANQALVRLRRDTSDSR